MPDSKPVMTTNAAILIIDGMESTAIANVLGPERYDSEYLQQLHYCYRSVFTSMGCLDHIKEETPIIFAEFNDKPLRNICPLCGRLGLTA